MSNKFEQALGTVGHDIKVGAEDVGKAVVWLPSRLNQAEKVIASVIKDSPVVKQDVITLIAKSTAVEAMIASDIATKGLNLPADLATVEAIKDLVAFLRGQFFTDMTTAYGEISADVKQAA